VSAPCPVYGVRCDTGICDHPPNVEAHVLMAARTFAQRADGAIVGVDSGRGHGGGQRVGAAASFLSSPCSPSSAPLRLLPVNLSGRVAFPLQSFLPISPKILLIFFPFLSSAPTSPTSSLFLSFPYLPLAQALVLLPFLSTFFFSVLLFFYPLFYIPPQSLLRSFYDSFSFLPD
jgi:hypothetical protein